MNETIYWIIGYVIGIVLAFICGRLNKEVHNNRDTIAELRDLNKKSGFTAEGGLETIAEIRERQQIDEQSCNCGNHTNCKCSACNNNSNIKGK